MLQDELDANEAKDVAQSIEDLYESVTHPRSIGDQLREVVSASGRELNDHECGLVVALQHEMRKTNGIWEVQNRHVLSVHPSNSELEPHLANAAEILAYLKEPELVARLAVLLWEFRVGPEPHVHARRAHSAYISIASNKKSRWLNRLRALDLAVHLAKSLSDKDLVAAAAQVASSVLAELEDLVPSKSDAFARAAEISAEVCEKQEVIDSIKRVENRFDHPNATQITGRVLYRLEATPSAYDAAISHLQREAASSEPLMRFVRLREAADLARRYGHSSASALRIQLEKEDPSQHLSTFEHEVPWTQLEVIQFTRAIVGDTGIEAALVRLVDFYRDVVAKLDATDNDSKPRSLASLSSTVTLGAHGSVTRSKSSHGIDYLANSATASATLAIVGSQALDSLLRTYECNEHEVTSLILSVTEDVDPRGAEVISHGLSQIRERRFESGSSTILPRLEQALRNYAIRHDVSVTIEETGNARGGVAGMGTVLQRLTESENRHVNQELVRRAKLTLVDDDPGLNLRNTILHGLQSQQIAGWQATTVVCALFDLIFVDSANVQRGSYASEWKPVHEDDASSDLE